MPTSSQSSQPAFRNTFDPVASGPVLAQWNHQAGHFCPRVGIGQPAGLAQPVDVCGGSRPPCIARSIRAGGTFGRRMVCDGSWSVAGQPV